MTKAEVKPLERTFEIINSRGLHARASAKFVRCAESFNAHVTVSRDGQTVVGTSIMGLMMLAAHPGSTIVVTASGPEAEQALDALQDLVAAKFHEDC
ncbi:HPr family phosphocarrier protein [Rhodoligotrophos ferricapiens]|uniref:HPr family phosphocarrier protein n=1 Tax=Rhodoligotrophos ferricapiens TaxID=3069264 RepID=UPI00315D034B